MKTKIRPVQIRIETDSFSDGLTIRIKKKAFLKLTCPHNEECWSLFDKNRIKVLFDVLGQVLKEDFELLELDPSDPRSEFVIVNQLGKKKISKLKRYLQTIQEDIDNFYKKSSFKESVKKVIEKEYLFIRLAKLELKKNKRQV